jgi:hypothetical protein
MPQIAHVIMLLVHLESTNWCFIQVSGYNVESCKGIKEQILHYYRWMVLFLIFLWKMFFNLYNETTQLFFVLNKIWHKKWN